MKGFIQMVVINLYGEDLKPINITHWQPMPGGVPVCKRLKISSGLYFQRGGHTFRPNPTKKKGEK
jgi:hypothetical protein